MTTRVVILAGGKGKRMGQPFAKVLTPLRGTPLIRHLLDAVAASGVDPHPVIVVGFDAEAVKKKLGNGYTYVFQKEQLGTGHAVRSAEAVLRGKADAVLVLYGDQPFIKPATIKALRDLHEKKRPAITMATVTVPSFENEWAPLYDFGRIIRDGKGRIAAIVERKDATEAELKIRELNPSFFCFDAVWLWSHLSELENKNAAREYYLTDLVRIAIDGGARIASMDVSPLESIGVNTPEHLELVQKLI